MKILYAIQGTGNGHIARAQAIIPALKERGEVDILISGSQADVTLDHEIKYRLNGLGFIFGKKGGIDIMSTYKKNNLKKLWTEVKALPVGDYDVVISDFEPVSSWACYIKNKPCIGLSHQAAVLNPRAPHPKHVDLLGLGILKYYAPASVYYGFHFQAYDHNVFTPVIRPQVRDLIPESHPYYTVYLPAYSDKRIIKMLSRFPETEWKVFSRNAKQTLTQNNITIAPISGDSFVRSMAGCKGVLCGAGFETPAEALFLRKKLLVIPMKGQYEQQCNAAALKNMGVSVVRKLKKKHTDKIGKWLKSEKIIMTNYPDNTAEVLETIFAHLPAMQPAKKSINEPVSTIRKFKDYILQKIFSQVAR